MSNIPKAREIIEGVLKTYTGLDPVLRRRLYLALSYMKRAPAVRRVKGQKTIITAAIRRQIHALAATGMTEFQIARATGVHNQGRISDVLNGKR